MSFVKRAAVVADCGTRATEMRGNTVSPDTVGTPLHRESQRRFVSQLKADAVEGGRAVGGKRATDLSGYFLGPAELVDVDDDSDAVGLEQFSPVLPITSWSNSGAILEPLNGMNQSVFGREGGLAGVAGFVTTRVIN